MRAEAHQQAGEITKRAKERADEYERQAKQRHDDVVGSLEMRREALQSQIEALEAFSREYRDRLTAFMQGQLRALWADEPRVDPRELEAATPLSVHVAVDDR